MKLIRITCCLFALLGVCAVNQAVAQIFPRDFDDQPWVEQQAKLPAFPKPENLLAAQLDVARMFQFLVDFSTLDVGQDGVVRYVLVARSASGSENVSFEGVRCVTRERKLYAVGRTDKTWVQSRNSTWISYARSSASYQAQLAASFFCPDMGIARDVAEIVTYLKRGGFKRPQEARD